MYRSLSGSGREMRRTRDALVVGLFVLLLGCVEPNREDDPDAIDIGALLPFTGELASSGINLERALLMAAEEANAHGGVAGRRLQVVAQDAPDIPRGLASMAGLLERPRLTALFGPQVADVYASIAPLIAEYGLYGVLPTEMALSATAGDVPVRWFHLAPRIETVACAMAQTIYNDLHMQLVILATDDDYNRSFAESLARTYGSLTYQGTRPEAKLHVFSASEWGSAINLQKLLPKTPAVIALVAFPKTGASVIQDWVASGRTDQWYFGPALRANVFVHNTPPDTLEGMKGFSAYIPEEAEARFSAWFAERWQGDIPLTDAFYYYDALALTALAVETAATRAKGAFPSADQVREQIIPVSRGPGIAVEWSSLATGLELVRGGQSVQYLGVSGPVDLTAEGYLEPTIETVSVWRVAAGRVEPFVKTTCLFE